MLKNAIDFSLLEIWIFSRIVCQLGGRLEHIQPSQGISNGTLRLILSCHLIPGTIISVKKTFFAEALLMQGTEGTEVIFGL